METYNYYEAVKNDVLNYIENNIDYTDFESLEDLEERLNNDLWVSDEVTGNGSGSYYCNAWKAEEAICHNLDLLSEAMKEFGCDFNLLKQGAEAADVTIRCYLLYGAIAEAMEEIEEDFEEAHQEE